MQPGRPHARRAGPREWGAWGHFLKCKSCSPKGQEETIPRSGDRTLAKGYAAEGVQIRAARGVSWWVCHSPRSASESHFLPTQEIKYHRGNMCAHMADYSRASARAEGQAAEKVCKHRVSSESHGVPSTARPGHPRGPLEPGTSCSIPGHPVFPWMSSQDWFLGTYPGTHPELPSSELTSATCCVNVSADLGLLTYERDNRPPVVPLPLWGTVRVLVLGRGAGGAVQWPGHWPQCPDYSLLWPHGCSLSTRDEGLEALDHLPTLQAPGHGLRAAGATGCLQPWPGVRQVMGAQELSSSSAQERPAPCSSGSTQPREHPTP